MTSDQNTETQQAKVGRNAILVTQVQEVTVDLPLSTDRRAITTLAELEKFTSTLRGLGAVGEDTIALLNAACVLRVAFPMRDLYPR